MIISTFLVASYTDALINKQFSMLKLTGITWIPTYNCNIACNHCFFETQGKKKYMDPELIEEVFASYKPNKQMFWQHLSGGEIFLDRKKLFQIIANIRNYFKKDIGISTNAFWADDIKKTREIVRQLIELGVNGIAISADYFHQQYLSTDRPKLLAQVIKEEGLKTHSYIMGARLHSSTNDAERKNKESETIEMEVKQGFEIPHAHAKMRSLGKGSKINSPKKSSIPSGMCTELCTCLGERTPFNPAMVWIDPYGSVMICYGLKIGNLHEKSFGQIIAEYDPNINLITKQLHNSGPKGLYKFAIRHRLNLPKDFFDECDMCYQVRRELAEIYPGVLGPVECYPC